MCSNLDHEGDSVINQAVLVPDAESIELLLVSRVKDLLEVVFPLSIVSLQDSVLCAHVHWNLLCNGHLEGGMGKVADGLDGIVHG